MSNQFSHEKIIQLRKKRSAADRRFKTYGLIATVIGMAILFFLLFTIFSKGYSSFQKTVIELDVTFDQETLKITPNATYEEQVEAKFFKVKKNAIANALPNLSKKDIKLMKKMFSINVDKEIKEYFLQNPNILNTTQKLLVTAHSDVDQMLKGNAKRNIEEKKRKLNDRQLEFFDEFVFTGRLKSKFNNFFFTNADSRHPELAGIAGSFVGSLFTLITVFISFSNRHWGVNLLGRICTKK